MKSMSPPSPAPTMKGSDNALRSTRTTSIDINNRFDLTQRGELGESRPAAKLRSSAKPNSIWMLTSTSHH